MHCDPTGRNPHDDTALHLAVVNGHSNIVRFFISDQNCDPNIPGQHGGTLQSSLCCSAWSSTYTQVFNWWARLQSCLDENFTPLHYAAMKGHMDIVKFLPVEKHCDPTCRDSKQCTPLHMAALNGHIQVVKFLTLETHCDPTSRDADNDTALHLVVVNGHLDILQFFAKLRPKQSILNLLFFLL